MTELVDPASYLASKGIHAYQGPGPEIIVHCMFCPDGDPKGKGKLYINTESWLYDCKRCGERGNQRTMYRHFGDEELFKEVVQTDLSLGRRILTEITDLAHEMLLANEAMIEKLVERGLNPQTILGEKLGYVPANVGITQMIPSFQAGKVKRSDLIATGVLTPTGREFFNDSLLIPYWANGQVVQLREKQPDGKYRTLGGDKPRLYNTDALRGASDVVITEGEYDALILQQSFQDSGNPKLMATAVVGLPGAGSWPDGLESWFQRAKRVFIGLDPDDTGRKFASKLKDALGQRARMVSLPKQLPKCDWTEYLRSKTPEHPHGGHTWEDVHRLLIEADLLGKRMFSIADAAARWETQKSNTPGVRLGWPTLDAVLRPGLLPGQVMVPLAKTGTGKTVWLNNIAHANANRRVLFISLEMTAVDVYEHLHRIHRFWNPEAPRSRMIQDYGLMRIVDTNKLTAHDISDVIEEYSIDVGDTPELVMIDYLGYLARSFRGNSNYERVSDAVMEVKGIAKEWNVPIIAPHQVNRQAADGEPIDADDARDSGAIEETADFVLGLWRPDMAVKMESGETATTGAFSTKIGKSRHGGKGKVFNLRFSNLSLALADVLVHHDAAHRIEEENTKYRQGVHYLDYRKQLDATQLEMS